MGANSWALMGPERMGPERMGPERMDPELIGSEAIAFAPLLAENVATRTPSLVPCVHSHLRDALPRYCQGIAGNSPPAASPQCVVTILPLVRPNAAQVIVRSSCCF